ncbi:RbsD or FucU transport [Caproiciproducens sp. NJN-50]|nr:RbsD/FucU family protein [Caproiciproducens sp. NJN-50]QAT51350.1 RbsD or FucU transport [Caproiciproducens sp. NJN-50]
MLTGDCIHPELMRVLSLLGHGDKVLIADGNYPLASKTGEAEKVWLGLKPGLPSTIDVLETLQSIINIEKAEVMDPGDGSSPKIFDEFQKRLGNMELCKLKRFPFYDACCEPSLRLAISTGEKRTFANILITVGVA